MLNRRHFRIKALQFLYGFYQSDDKDLKKWESEFVKGLKAAEDLFCWYAALLVELRQYRLNEIAAAKQKLIPSYEDLNPNLQFVNLDFLVAVELNKPLAAALQKRKINFTSQSSLIKQVFRDLAEQDFYRNFLKTPATNETINVFAKQLLTGFFPYCEPFQFFLEEKSILWSDDHEVALTALLKWINQISPTLSELELPPLVKLEEDMRFGLDLFRKTANHDEEISKIISRKTSNWEMERIALMDVIILKLAICELLHFPSIPVKVTLNEYIELSKQYSTPKSRQFVNGVLDAAVKEFREEGIMKKSGRGLIE
ncbi:MAG: transcription antitermination factor NusB [Bacteroidota bacterium]